MVQPLTTAVIVCLFFSEAIKKGGKALAKGADDTFTLVINTIREKFGVEGTEGLLKRAENEPTLANKAKLQDELETQTASQSSSAFRFIQLSRRAYPYAYPLKATILETTNVKSLPQ
jgi:hypothetical protein